MPRETLQRVPWLASLGGAALDEFADCAERVSFAPGATILVELEVGVALYIVTAGHARVSVSAGEDRRRELAVLGPGDACGEIALVTRELHSATVVADGPVEALRIEAPEFERLIERHPEVAVHFARIIATRVTDTDAALDALLAPGATTDETVPRGSLARAWRELVISQGRELPMVALLAFVATLCVVRGGIALAQPRGLSLFGFLRTAYTCGIGLVFASTALSLWRFRPRMQRALAVAYGMGFALILNELSVFLAFDVFYLDMTTPDPNLVFDVVELYRRSESLWAIALMIAFLVQLTFLRRFYRRVLFVLSTRLLARR